MIADMTEQKQKILIVDDSEMNRSILADMLGEDEYEFIEAENGVRAVEILNEQAAELSLVLLDIVMPEMDGFAVLQMMNQNKLIELVPVIMISSESDSQQVARAYEMGVTDFIARPFDAIIVHRRAVNTILLYAKQKQLIKMVSDQIRDKERQSNMMIDMLSSIVEIRNGESGPHTLHVRTLTELLLLQFQKTAEGQHITASDISNISTASAFHDVGKISIDEEILNKPGKLTAEEFDIMKAHTIIGADMLEQLPNYQNEPLIKAAYEICRWHHERYDGRGYPDGLKGDEIPISAQVVSIADVYDALTSERVYKKAFSHETAMEMILGGQCGVFNPVLLKCLQEIEDDLKTSFQTNQMQLSWRRTQELTYEAVSSNLNTSERSLRLLDSERMKHNSFALLTGEIEFEYTSSTDTLVLSAWGAKKLGVKEIIKNPGKDASIDRVLGREVWEQLAEALRGSSPQNPLFHCEGLLQFDGQKRWHMINAMALWSGEDFPQCMGATGKVVDIHDALSHLRELEKQAYHDMLTGLLNHASAREKIREKMKQEPEKNWNLVILDLDRFKTANDNYGHLFGDNVLRYVAEKIRQNAGPDDITARVGGDEFLIFTEDIPEFAEKSQQLFESLEGVYEDFPVNVSMGIAGTAVVGKDYEPLFHAADQALYSAKRAGRKQYHIYDETMNKMLSAISPIDRAGSGTRNTDER